MGINYAPQRSPEKIKSMTSKKTWEKKTNKYTNNQISKGTNKRKK